MASVWTIFVDTDPTISAARKQSLSDLSRLSYLTCLSESFLQHVYDVTVIIP